MSFKKPKGTVDFYPEEMEVRKKIIDSIRDTARKYGFSEIETPAFEELSLLTKKSGDEVKTQIFTLEKKGNEELGLRFDMTIPAARMFVAKQTQLPKPVKWFYITRMWRYEKPQAGRLREFYQFGVEVFGSGKIYADIEVVSLIVDTLKALGLKEKDFAVKINNRDLVEGILESIVPKEKVEDVIKVIDKFKKLPEETFLDSLKEIGVNAEGSKKIKQILKNDSIEKISKLELNEKAKKGLESLKTLYSSLPQEFIEIDLSVVRGLAYYTGTVFEVFDKDEKFRAIAGGGRYDNLVKLLGGQQCPAVGFGMGMSTLSLLLEDKKLFSKTKGVVDYYIAPVNKDMFAKSFEICNKLRENFSVDIDISGRNLGNQFDYANSIGAKKTIIVGPKDLEKKEVTVRDMESGKESKVPLTEL